MNFFVRITLELIRFVVIAIWAVLGLIFWIPLLVRMTFAFTSTVVVSAFSEVDLKAAEAGLHHATRFYVIGFKIINQTIDNVVSNEPLEESPKGLNRERKQAVWLNLGFSLLFWVITVGTIVGVYIDWNNFIKKFDNNPESKENSMQLSHESHFKKTGDETGDNKNNDIKKKQEECQSLLVNKSYRKWMEDPDCCTSNIEYCTNLKESLIKKISDKNQSNSIKFITPISTKARKIPQTEAATESNKNKVPSYDDDFMSIF